MASTLACGGISLALVFYVPEVFLSLELSLLVALFGTEMSPFILTAFFWGGGFFLFIYFNF